MGRRSPWLSVLALLACIGCRPEAAGPNPATCEQSVAAYDIGSATTKMQVAVIDVCRQRLVRPLVRATRKVPYGEDVSLRGRISASTLAQGTTALGDIAQQARAYRPRSELAVATEAFRTASNGTLLTEQLGAATELPIRVLSQEQEAVLAFWAAVNNKHVAPHDAVVWDVGGESMQVTAMVDGVVRAHGVAFASGDMRRHLVVEVQGKPADASPNPVSADEAAVALVHGRTQAIGVLPAWLRRKLRRADVVVIGVGALRYYSDVGSDPATCSREGLRRALSQSLSRSDEQIGGAYAAARVPDLVLFQAVLERFAVERIAIADVDLTDGLLVLRVTPQAQQTLDALAR